MGKGKEKIFIFALTIICALLFCNCNKKEEKTERISKIELKKFTLKQFSDNFNLTVIGECAEVKEENIKIKNPSFLINNETEYIEIKTGKDGNAEIKIDQNNKAIQYLIFTGDIKITQKDKKSGEIIMEAECGKLTYNDKDKELLMEISPVIKKGENIFSGEKIYYFLEKNTLQIKGNVNVKIIPEK